MKDQNSTSPSGTFVATIDPALAPKIMQDLIEQGFELTKPACTAFSAKKKGINCTLYLSGKLTVQGSEMKDFIEFYLEPQVLKTFTLSYSHIDESLDKTGRIGIDESGKGDFFGPLCVAGVFAEGEEISKLKSFGVRDSKTLTEISILKIGDNIRRHFAHQIVKINPAKYNELIIQFKNLNHLLAWGHATAIEQLVEKTTCRKVIIDQFASEHVVITALKRKNLLVDLTQRHRGEEDLVVAAASILARQAFVESLKKMEKEFGLEFPKGASSRTISAGRAFIRKHGRENLGLVGKLHFKTLDSILKEG
ncbi:MAG: ribonuclease HIII [Parachlamydiaceae bacterium]|nr:ribonuclease HIII [Parachlamydiaceae bacterium]